MSLFKEVAFPGKYRDDNAIHDLVNYITQPNKTHNEIVDGMHVADAIIIYYSINPSKAATTTSYTSGGCYLLNYI